MKIKNIIEILNTKPYNIILLSDEDLELAVSKVDFLTKTIKNKLLAEVLCRYWLFKTNYNIDKLKNVLNQDDIHLFWEETKYVRDNIQSGWDEKIKLPFVSDLNESIKQRLKIYIQCDGIILTVSNQNVIPIPFSLHPSTNGFYVEDVKNIRIILWSRVVNNLHKYNVSPWGIHLCIDNKNHDIGSFTGESLALPIIMSIARKEGRISYSPLDVLCSGSFGIAGKLSNVEGILAKIEMANRLHSKIFFIPKQEVQIEEEFVVELSKDLNIKETEESIKSHLIEKDIDSLDWREAKNLLKNLGNDVHYGIIALENALTKLDKYQSVFELDSRTEEIILANALRGAILCHMGKTAEAFSVNKECQQMAKKNNLDYIYGKCEIRQIVNMTDFGDFDNTIEEDFIIRDFIDKAHLSPNDKNDLLLRYFGSFGQVYAYKALITNEAKFRDKSLDYFKKAVTLAIGHDNIEEIIQDLNYIHLWHALFDFNSENEKEAYNNAYNKIIDNDKNVRDRNLSYLYRQKAFGAYRNYLLTGEVYTLNELKLPSEKNAEGWTLAMTLKYTATLKVAQKDVDSAKQDFEDALICLGDSRLPLLTLLKMTISVQIYNSLQNTQFADFAEKNYNDALQFFSNKNILKTYHFAKDWKLYLEKKDVDIKNPQLTFQY